MTCRLGRTAWSWLLNGSLRTLRLLQQAPVLLPLAVPSTQMTSS